MKSSFNRKKVKGADAIKLYELSYNYVVSQAGVIWQASQLFLLGNTFLSGFLGTIVSNKSFKDNTAIFLLSLVGIFMSILWLISHSRVSNYYKFRIAQAKQREPEGWMIFNGDGENFSKGKSVKIAGVVYNFGVGKITNLNLVRAMTIVFMMFYLYIAISYRPDF